MLRNYASLASNKTRKAKAFIEKLVNLLPFERFIPITNRFLLLYDESFNSEEISFIITAYFINTLRNSQLPN